MYPYFNISHYILVCLLTKERFSKENKNFSRLFPLAHYILTMVLIFAGSIIVNLLFGDSLTTILDNSTAIFHASICWYLINYSPGNVIFKICKLKPVLFIICLMKEVHRSKNIFTGIEEAAIRFPNSYLVWIIVGTIRGSGTNWLLSLGIHVIHKDFITNEFMNPSYVSKISFLVSIAYSMNYVSNYVSVQVAFMIAVLVLVYFRSLILFTGNGDPLSHIYSVLCFIFLGGFTDKMTSILQKRNTIEDNKKQKDQ